ncbi:MAG TPA: hypothetical protein VI168_08285 [Croceibacterium sp.]
MFTGVRTLALGGLLGALLAAPPALAQSDEEPLARFEDPVCPGVAGLEREAAEAMVGRMRENVEAFGLRMAQNGDCEANLIVAFVDDGNAMLSKMETDARYLFAEMNLDDRRALLEGPGPAHAVHQLVPRARDGRPIPRYESPSEIPQTQMWMAHSKIYLATRNDIVYSLILIERDGIGSANVRQLADYATFRALSRDVPDPAAAGEASILTLFDERADHPAELTEFDRAYLGSLYAGQANLPSSAKLADIARATGTNTVE